MPHEAMACLRAFLSPVARTVYKYSVGFSEADSRKPYSVVNALREYYGDIVRASGERQKFLPLPFFLPFWQKRYPFYIPFIETSTPFIYLLLKQVPLSHTYFRKPCSHFYVGLTALSVRFEVGVSLLLAPAGADKRSLKPLFL